MMIDIHKKQYKGTALKTMALLFIISINSVQAQITKAVVGINGLTCSACSFATEKSIRQLNFVDSVNMDLVNNIATVYFSKTIKVNLDDVSKKVYDAGFSVRSLEAFFYFNQVSVSPHFCFEYANDSYNFFEVKETQLLNGEVKLKLIAKKYMTKREYKLWKSKIDATPLCHQTSKTYFVTL